MTTELSPSKYAPSAWIHLFQGYSTAGSTLTDWLIQGEVLLIEGLQEYVQTHSENSSHSVMYQRNELSLDIFFISSHI